MDIVNNIIAYFHKKNPHILQYTSLIASDQAFKEVIQYIKEHRPKYVDELIVDNKLQNYKTQSFISLLKEEYNSFLNKSIEEKEQFVSNTIEKLIQDAQKEAVVKLIRDDTVSYDQLSKTIEQQTKVIVDNLKYNKQTTYLEINSQTVEDIFENITSIKKRVPLGMKTLDEKLGGGVPTDSFIIFLAPTGGGKTTLMSYLTGNLLKMGKNVAYISFEEDKKRITSYIIQSMLGVTEQDIKTKPEEIKKRVAEVFRNCGTLYVEDYVIDPKNYFSDNFRKFSRKALRDPYEFIDTFHGLDLDYIFVDYIGSMMNSGLFTGDNSYELGDAVSRFLKSTSNSFNIPVITAQQINREGLQLAERGDKIDSIDISKTSGSVAIPFWADALFVMVADKRKREASIFSLKNRIGAPVEKTYITVDFATKRFELTRTDLPM